MNTWTKRIIAAGAASTLLSLVVPAPAHAEASTPGMPTHCYAWPSDALRLVEPNDGGKGQHSDPVMVTDGSPCRDINVRQVVGPDGRGLSRDLRVRWTRTGKTEAWHRVGKGWRVLSYRAAEGETYTIESRNGEAVQVQVRG